MRDPKAVRSRVSIEIVIEVPSMKSAQVEGASRPGPDLVASALRKAEAGA